MPRDLSRTFIYHITSVTNLPRILEAGGLFSDAALVGRPHEVIGYENIKSRRLTCCQVPCCGDRFVGEFVPFYYCPRSPMLLAINSGKTGRPPGCQREIVHLVSSVAKGVEVATEWAISDGNAGAAHTSFYSKVEALDALDWDAIGATMWVGRQHEKAAEFLVADFFSWDAIVGIGCMDEAIAAQVQQMLPSQGPRPKVVVRPQWYYT